MDAAHATGWSGILCARAAPSVPDSTMAATTLTSLAALTVVWVDSQELSEASGNRSPEEIPDFRFQIHQASDSRYPIRKRSASPRHSDSYSVALGRPAGGTLKPWEKIW